MKKLAWLLLVGFYVIQWNEHKQINPTAEKVTPQQIIYKNEEKNQAIEFGRKLKLDPKKNRDVHFFRMEERQL